MLHWLYYLHLRLSQKTPWGAIGPKLENEAPKNTLRFFINLFIKSLDFGAAVGVGATESRPQDRAYNNQNASLATLFAPRVAQKLLWQHYLHLKSLRCFTGCTICI